MKVVNESLRATADILPLVEFVSARTKYADMAYVHLYRGLQDEEGFPLVGRAQAEKNNENPRGTTPSRVDMWVSEGALFPFDSEYPEAGVGVVTLLDWREEFILTLAHELRHIDQFWWSRPAPANIEHDAESFAVQVLNEWRRKNSRVPTVPYQRLPIRFIETEQPVRRAARKSRRSG